MYQRNYKQRALSRRCIFVIEKITVYIPWLFYVPIEAHYERTYVGKRAYANAGYREQIRELALFARERGPKERRITHTRYTLATEVLGLPSRTEITGRPIRV